MLKKVSGKQQRHHIKHLLRHLSLIQLYTISRLSTRCTWTVQSYSSGCASAHPPFNTCFLGTIRVDTPNGISIGSAVFLQGSRSWQTETDRQTDQATPSVTAGRSHVCNSAHRVITCHRSWRHRRLETERWPPLKCINRNPTWLVIARAWHTKFAVIG